MTTHELKVVQPYMEALLDGSKTFEVRRNDRGFQRGDVLRLREYVPPSQFYPGRFTEREVIRTVSYVYSDDPRFPALERGFVVLGLSSEPVLLGQTEETPR